MEQLRQRLLQCTEQQTNLIEIFSAIDHDCSGRISFEEFRTAIQALELNLNNNEEIKELFRQFDTTNNGQIDLYEFLQQLQPPMNERRQKAALNLFHSLDMNRDGKITILDLKIKYMTQLIPTKTRSSEKINLALRKFLNRFDTRGKEDGVIDQDEFLRFCSMLSVTVQDDVYFEHVLRMFANFNI